VCSSDLAFSSKYDVCVLKEQVGGLVV